MNKKKSLFIFSLICLMNLSSCKGSNSSSIFNSSSLKNESSISTNSNEINSSSSNNSTNISNSSSNPIESYTVIWQNFDGTILEEDLNVPYGSIPSYDGLTPKKKENGVNYIFTGWTPEITIVTENVTYVAIFNEVTNYEYKPLISLDNKSIEYGYYPQSNISDETLINNLNSLNESSNGWYLYEGNYYVKEVANTYKGASLEFNNGTSVVNDNTYWFKCEPIKWNILSSENETYFLLSSLLLDVQKYHNNYEKRIINNETVYANNYEYSDIRSWLNNEFYNTAFNLNNSYIQNTFVNNSSITTDNENNNYSCNNTNDKVYLPSYEDYLNENYGFSSINEKSDTRVCKVTDYAIAKGAWYNTEGSLKYNGTYFTRSATSEYYYCAWNINSGGYLSSYAIDGDNHSVRPCISITFEDYVF